MLVATAVFAKADEPIEVPFAMCTFAAQRTTIYVGSGSPAERVRVTFEGEGIGGLLGRAQTPAADIIRLQEGSGDVACGYHYCSSLFTIEKAIIVVRC